MSINRDQILKHVRHALDRSIPVDNISDAFSRLISDHSTPVQPQIDKDLIETFNQSARESSASVHNIDSLSNLPAWLAQHTESLNQRPSLVLSKNLSDSADYFSDYDVIPHVKHTNNWGFVKAYAGIAETGTVVSTSEDCSCGMLFLAERLIVVLKKTDIVAFQEDIWLKLKQRFDGRMPRTINLITGPSRTADVEQTIQLGAHGPKWVDYVVVDN